MRRRQSVAALFVIAMLALGGAIVLHWRSQEPRHFDNDLPAIIDWHPASPKQFLAAKSTVIGQLSAFRSDDFQEANRYQSEALRLNFYSVRNFRAIITGRYPEFCTFATVVFGRCTADPNGDLLRLDIMLLSKEGRRTRAAYLLRQENGQYRVAGVQPGEEDPVIPGTHDGNHFPGASPFPSGGHFPGRGPFPGGPFPSGHYPGGPHFLGGPHGPGGQLRIGNAGEPF
jgi:hypothetical protein